MSFLFSIFFSVFIFVPSLLAQGIESSRFRSFISSRFNTDISKNNELEDRFEIRERFFFEAKLAKELSLGLGNLISLVSSKLEYEVLMSGFGSKYIFRPELFEAYFMWANENAQIAIGRMIKTWGYTDVSPLDVLNPKDFSEYLFNEDEFLKIPNFLFSLGGSLDELSIEVVYLPFFEPSRYYRINYDWAILPPFALKGSQEDLKPFISERVRLIEEDFQRYDLRYPEAGAKFEAKFGGTEFSLIYFWGLDRLPFPSFDPVFLTGFKRRRIGEEKTAEEMFEILFPMETTEITSEINGRPLAILKSGRFHLLGLGLASEVRDWLLKWDISFVWKNPFLNEDLNIVRHPLLSSVFQTEHNFRDVTIIIPINLSVALTDEKLFILKTYPFTLKSLNPVVSGLLRWTALGQDFTSESGVSYDITWQSYLISQRFSYNITDEIKLLWGANILGGRRASPFGFFNENDHIFLWLRYFIL